MEEQFIAEMDIENMSVRELQKAVKDRDQAHQDREQAFQDRDRALQEKTDLRMALDGEKDKNTQLTKERDNLKAKERKDRWEYQQSLTKSPNAWRQKF